MVLLLVSSFKRELAFFDSEPNVHQKLYIHTYIYMLVLNKLLENLGHDTTRIGGS